jgi:hypothetical protein
MKRQRIPLFVAVAALALFSWLDAKNGVYAQSGKGALPTTKPTPAPKPRPTTTKPSTPAPPVAPVTPVTPTLVFNQELNGRLDPQGSEKGAGGSLFQEYILNAKSNELLTIRLQSETPALGLQILDGEKKEVALTKDAASGEFKISSPTGALPGDGEYRLRVTGAVSGKTTIPYTVRVNRLGLTGNAYNERFNNIYTAYAALPEGNSAGLDETLAKLEELAKDDENRATTFELLGIIYLYNKHDAAKAGQAMEQAIKLKGAAVVKINYDSQWRRMAKLRSGNFGWEDARTGWLRIRPGQIALTDPSNKTLASLSGPQIKELSKILTATSNLVTITAENVRKPFVFAPGSGQQAEADLVIKLIQNYVMGKTN